SRAVRPPAGRAARLGGLLARADRVVAAASGRDTDPSYGGMMLRLHVPMALVLALAAGAARAASFEEGLALKKQEKLAEAEAGFAGDRPRAATGAAGP